MKFFLLSFLFALSLNGNPEKIALKHVEGKGLGYSSGYTSLDLFLSQPLCNWTVVPFAELRGHLFNNGKCAYNAGMGMRYLQESCEIIWGINGFYDYLETGHRDYHQVSFGLEVLSEDVGLHINSYLPVGHTKTPLLSFKYENPLEHGFLVKGREQLALKGFDVMLDYRCFNQQTFNVYVGAGPYFYWGKTAATKNAFNQSFRRAYGGRLNFGADIKDYAILDVKVTYDTLYRWGGQVLLSFQFSFDWTLNFCEEARCGDYLEEKLYQFVSRNEIIVRKTTHRFTHNPLILDPEFIP